MRDTTDEKVGDWWAAETVKFGLDGTNLEGRSDQDGAAGDVDHDPDDRQHLVQAPADRVGRARRGDAVGRRRFLQR